MLTTRPGLDRIAAFSAVTLPGGPEALSKVFDADDGAGVEAGVGPQRHRALPARLVGGQRVAQPGQHLGDERAGATARAGVAAAQPGVQQLGGTPARTVPGAAGQQRVIAAHPGVLAGGALFGQPVHLADRRIQVHRDVSPGGRAGAGPPRLDQQRPRDRVELPDLAPAQRP